MPVAGSGSGSGPIVATARLVLRPFQDMDRAPFFALNTHPLVVESLGSAPTRAESDDMIERYSAEMLREGWGLWAVGEPGDGGAAFVGMVGLHQVRPELPCAPAVESAGGSTLTSGDRGMRRRRRRPLCGSASRMGA